MYSRYMKYDSRASERAYCIGGASDCFSFARVERGSQIASTLTGINQSMVMVGKK